MLVLTFEGEKFYNGFVNYLETVSKYQDEYETVLKLLERKYIKNVNLIYLLVDDPEVGKLLTLIPNAYLAHNLAIVFDEVFPTDASDLNKLKLIIEGKSTFTSSIFSNLAISIWSTAPFYWCIGKENYWTDTVYDSLYFAAGLIANAIYKLVVRLQGDEYRDREHYEQILALTIFYYFYRIFKLGYNQALVYTADTIIRNSELKLDVDITEFKLDKFKGRVDVSIFLRRYTSKNITSLYELLANAGYLVDLQTNKNFWRALANILGVTILRVLLVFKHGNYKLNASRLAYRCIKLVLGDYFHLYSDFRTIKRLLNKAYIEYIKRVYLWIGRFEKTLKQLYR